MTGGDRIIHGTWLAPRILTLLVEVRAPTLEGPAWRIVADAGGEPLDLGMRRLPCSPRAEGTASLWLLTVIVPERALGKPLRSLVLHGGEQRVGLTPWSASRAITPVAGFATACRARIAGAFRDRAQTLLTGVSEAYDVELTRELAANLAVLRDALREPLPTTALEPGPHAFRLERVIGFDNYGFWCSGLIHDAAPREVRLSAVSPEGVRGEVAPAAVSYHPRPSFSAGLGDDGAVSTTGFDAYVELASPSRHPSGWVMEFHTSADAAFEHHLRAPVQAGEESVWQFATPRRGAEAPSPATFATAFLPAVQRLRGGVHAAQISRTFTFGVLPREPEVSVVLAAEDALQVEHSIVALAADPELAGSEVIYVVWSEDEDDLVDQVESLHDLHRMGLRLITLTRRATRQRATNLGAEVATGTLLMVMNGEVLPSAAGWLGVLLERYRGTDQIRAVAPKLLREDESIAYAGAGYVKRASGRWERRAPLAGLARDTPGARNSRPVHALPEACMLVDRAAFRAAGGFCDLYLEGDSGEEGGDLCLRLAGDGEAWYEAQAELYLLDEDERRESPPRLHARFNDWLLAKRCSGALEALTGAPEPDGDGGPPRAPEPRVPGGPRLELHAIDRADPDGPVQAADLIDPDPPEQPRSPWPGTYALALDGWALPRGEEPLVVELRHGTDVLDCIEATLPSDGVAARFPEHPRSRACGFRLLTTALRLPQEFLVTVEAVAGEDHRVVLGAIRGRRRRLRTRHRPRLQPLLVTTMGRSGSRRLVDLLSQVPGVVALVPNVEARLAQYWIDALLGLSAPQSFMQMILPDLTGEDWWLRRRQNAVARHVEDGTMPRWLGGESIDDLAVFAQTRFEEFYRRVADRCGEREARYFVEKVTAGQAARLIGELYPSGREIVLVRDLRDVVCSIDSYNAKRGLHGWGRAEASDDATWLDGVGSEYRQLHQAWRERRERAHLLRYEDLVTNPERELASILRYLDLDASPATVRNVLSAAEDLDPRGQRFHQTSPSVPESIGRWKRELTPERRALLARNFDDILIELEYEPTETPLARTA